jgi:uncharacterized membrane protein YccF (DUF307 family)
LADNLDTEEWKACLDQANTYEGNLNDLRKYGFTLITGIATAGSFLGFDKSNAPIQVGIVIANMVLVGILYWLEQHYQNYLSGALVTGKVLEIRLRRSLISNVFEMNWGRSTLAGAWIYIGFLIALLILGNVATLEAIRSQNLSLSAILGQRIQGATSANSTSTAELSPQALSASSELLWMIFFGILTIILVIYWMMEVQRKRTVQLIKRKVTNMNNEGKQLKEKEAKHQSKRRSHHGRRAELTDLRIRGVIEPPNAQGTLDTEWEEIQREGKDIEKDSADFESRARAMEEDVRNLLAKPWSEVRRTNSSS